MATTKTKTVGKNKDEVVIAVNKREFRAAIAALYPFVDPTGSRYALEGIKFEISDGLLTMAATTGRVLAIARLKIQYSGPAKEYLLPGRVLRDLTLGNKDYDYIFVFRPNGVTIENAKVSSTFGYVEGRFPDWHSIIPADTPTGQVITTVDTFKKLYEEPPVGTVLTFNEEGVESTLDMPPTKRWPDIPTMQIIGEAKIQLNREWCNQIFNNFHDKEVLTLSVYGKWQMCMGVFTCNEVRQLQLQFVVMGITID